MQLLRIFAVAATGLALPAQAGRTVSADEARAWNEDLTHLDRELRSRHANLFHTLTQDEYATAVEELRARLPELRRSEIIVGLAQLVARIGDGHTSLPLLWDPAAGFHRCPIRFGQYLDEVYVEAADRAHEAAVGGRVTAVSGVEVAEALERVASVVSRDNDVWLRTVGPMLLSCPEVLHALGLSESSERASYTIALGDRELTVSAPRVPGGHHGHGIPLFPELSDDWVDARTEGPRPIGASRPERPFWFESLAGALFVQINAIRDTESESLAEFSQRAVAELERTAADRLVLDLRLCLGGNGLLNEGVVSALRSSARLRDDGRLFVLIGRRTYSAGMALATALEQDTTAVFVGEETGSSPNSFGDHEAIRLPSSGVVVMVAPTRFDNAGADDTRSWIRPQIPVPPTFADYLDNRDAAVETVIRPPLAILHADVVDPETGTVTSDQCIVVAAGRIVRVGPVATTEIPEHARRIDADGLWAAPGLCDMHVHIGESAFPLLLAHGVTTVCEMNGSDRHLRMRALVRAGARLGPRMFVSTELLAGEQMPWRHRLLTTPDAARETVRQAVASGYDYVKVYDGLRREVFDALADTAKRLGIRLVGHIPEPVGFDAVLATGLAFQHTEKIINATMGHDFADERIDGIAAAIRDAECWVVPTLAAQKILCSQGTVAFEEAFDATPLEYVSRENRGWWRTLRVPKGTARRATTESRYYAIQRNLVAALAKAGVPMLTGTDTPNPLLVPGFSLALEFAALREAGLSPREVLRAATSRAYAFAGGSEPFGRIAPGHRADIVLVRHNPLKRVVEHPEGVVAAGAWLPRAQLDGLLFVGRGAR